MNGSWPPGTPGTASPLTPDRYLSSLVAGRMQAGPQSTPPRAGFELDDWQDPELFHSPEL